MLMRLLPRYCGLLGITALLVAVPLGCEATVEENRPREAVSGTVTFDGQPLQKGTIQFQPASQDEGVAAGGMIDGGRFDIPKQEGPVPGKYKVSVNAQEESGTTLPPGELPGSLQVPKKRPAA